ncbi:MULTISPECIES: hypothetical protein [unclassified Microcoleus]|uniref:hypothetical protein n=1 Tax=unclassified Microcoleus TaxID=2642155 RepID=UPI0025D053E7|nr:MULTISPECIES: hypothetical protein [unclassified Microcoleus]
MSSPVARTDLSYFFFQHTAIVLASAAIGVRAALAVNLPERIGSKPARLRGRN